MKKIYYSFMAMAAAAMLASCGGDEPDPAPTPTPGETEGDVEVTISTSEIETKASAVTEFKASDKMNIFAKTYGAIDAPNIVDNVVASLDGNKWTMTPAVKINQTQKNAFVYAVAPYDASYTDAQKIPIDINKQVDLMYSGAYVPASLKHPDIKLNMKHALSLMTFNIVPVGFNGAGNLKSIKVGGDLFFTSGTMNTNNGKITKGETGSVTVNFNKIVADGGWKADLPGVWAIPFNTKTGSVEISFEIDGKKYDLNVPEVEMKQGFQYIFRLALTNNGLEFDPSKTETISLNVNTEEPQSFLGFGSIVITAGDSWIFAPAFSGDAVFGTISTPQGNKPYAPSAKVEGLNANQKVVIESWNSTGFTIEALDGVTTIDLTNYE